MAKIPVWLQTTRHLTTYTVIPQTVGSDGTLTAGTSNNCLGIAEEISVEQENDTENITPMTVRSKNYVINESETTITLIGIVRADVQNILSGLAETSDYCQVNFSRGQETWSMYGVIQSFRETLRKGKVTHEVRIQQVVLTTGGANPVYSSP